MIKDLLEYIRVGIRAEFAARISEADTNPDKWYELMVIYNDGSTQTVESGGTFDECFKSVCNYIDKYRFDRMNIDIWKDRNNPENEEGLFCQALIYKRIREYLENKKELRWNNMCGSFHFDEQGKPADHQTEYNGTGSIFKDEIAFTYFSDMVCYISEGESEDEFDLEEDGYLGSTYQDILSICKGHKDNARSLFNTAEWEHPSTIYDQWDYNGILEEEEVDGKPVLIVFSDEGDLVKCTWCEKIMIVPTGADKCPHCYYVGSLGWIENEKQEVKLSEIEDENKFHMVIKDDPEPEEYLSKEVLQEEFDITPSGKYENKDKPFDITLTMIHNASIIVHAKSKEAAMTLVQNNMDRLAPDSIFQFGEKTVDYAKEVNE